MKRRHFLQLSGAAGVSLGLSGFGLNAFANPSAVGLDLNLPARLKDNPLLDFVNLPNFAAIKAEHIIPAVEFIISYTINAVETLTAQKNPTWQSFYLPLEDAQSKLDRVWTLAGLLNGVKSHDDIRNAYKDAQKLMSEFDSWFGMYQPLYKAYQKLKADRAYQTYSQAQKQAINNALQDFELSGVSLTGDKAKRFAEISKRLSELSTQFGNNIIDANSGFEILLPDDTRLKGLPDNAIAAAQKSAQSKGLSGYRFGLDYPSYSAVINFADDRELRRTMYEAYRTRASDQGPNAGKWDNTAIMQEITSLRYEQARLLGYKNFSEFALVKRMADNTDEVMAFLNNLKHHARPKALEDATSLEKFGQSLGLIDKLEPWDLFYLQEKQKQTEHELDQAKIAEYFPLDKVMAGLFEVTKRLYGVTFNERKVSVWHPDVRYFDVYLDGNKIAGIYLDLFARDKKRSGAWMSSIVERRRDPAREGGIELPVAMVGTNFSSPTAGAPALLKHDDVVTLFHEFGHALHQALTKIDVWAVSGIMGVPRDAVEFPSQMFENWVWDKQTLGIISGHYETGKTLPDELIDKMIAAKNYHAALSLYRQLEYALFDFRLNNEYQPGDTNAIARIRDAIKADTVVPDPEWTRMAHAFNHIFSGGYASGYYSYLWSEVLAGDAYTRFEKEGIFNRATGQAFVDSILGQGGSDKPMTLYKRFAGREPDPQALLKQRGIL